MTLNRNFYLVHNTISEIATHFDDVYRLVASLYGRRTNHLIIYVVKGDKAKLVTVDNDIMAFQKYLIETMNKL